MHGNHCSQEISDNEAASAMWRRSVRGVDFPPYILPTKGFDFLIPLL
jgi:hypothetical protein